MLCALHCHCACACLDFMIFIHTHIEPRSFVRLYWLRPRVCEQSSSRPNQSSRCHAHVHCVCSHIGLKQLLLSLSLHGVLKGRSLLHHTFARQLWSRSRFCCSLNLGLHRGRISLHACARRNPRIGEFYCMEFIRCTSPIRNLPLLPVVAANLSYDPSCLRFLFVRPLFSVRFR